MPLEAEQQDNLTNLARLAEAHVQKAELFEKELADGTGPDDPDFSYRFNRLREEQLKAARATQRVLDQAAGSITPDDLKGDIGKVFETAKSDAKAFASGKKQSTQNHDLTPFKDTTKATEPVNEEKSSKSSSDSKSSSKTESKSSSSTKASK
jgi:hypothetical protein